MRSSDTCPLAAGATVWGYLRDSGGPGQDRSVDQQRAELVAYCEKHQLVLERVFSDAARQGDSTEERAALDEMRRLIAERFPHIHNRRKRQAIASHIQHGIIFWSMARLGRDRFETGLIRNDLRVRGLVLISLSDNILTGNETIDPIIESLLDFKNQQDLEVISREAKRGLHAVVTLRDTDPTFLANNPGWQPTGRYLSIFPGRCAPVGYKTEQTLIGKRRDGRPRLIQRLRPDPETWERAKLAWRMRVFDYASYSEIHQVVSLYSKSTHYTSFFRNRIYSGVFEFGGEVYGSPDDPFVEPLIPLEWYEIEQERRAKQAVRRRKGGHAQPGMPDPRHQSHGRLLSGLLVCSRCGSPMHVGHFAAGIISTTGQLRKEWPFYRCSAAKEGKCDAGKINAVRLEEAILARLRTDVLSPERLREHIDLLLVDLSASQREAQARLQALKTQLAQAGKKADSLTELLIERPTSQVLLHKLDETEADQRRLTLEIQTAQSELVYWSTFRLDDKQIEELTNQVVSVLEHGETNQARMAIRAFISRIEVEHGKPVQGTVYYTYSTQKRGVSMVPPGGFEPPFWP